RRPGHDRARLGRHRDRLRGAPLGMPDDAHIRGLTSRRLSRRQLLARAGTAAGALSAASLLAACGETTRAATVGSAAWWQGQRPTGELAFANWPLYIDYTNWLKDRPSLNSFSRHTG